VTIGGAEIKISLRYGVGKALGADQTLGLGIAGDRLLFAGTVYDGTASVLPYTYWDATGGCLGSSGRLPRSIQRGSGLSSAPPWRFCSRRRF